MPGTKAWGNTIPLPYEINATDLAAGTSFEMIAPITGIIKGFSNTIQVAIVTGGAIKLAIGTTDVVGASITVADAATKGTVQTVDATVPSATRSVTKGDRVQIIPAAAFNGGGAVNGFVEFSSGE